MKCLKIFSVIILTLSLIMLSVSANIPKATNDTQLQFSDISGHWAEETILKWRDEGIVNGYPDGTFRPDAYITRAELAKIITLAFGLEIPDENANGFNDVAADAWYYDYVNAASVYIPSYCPPDLVEATRPYENLQDAFLPDNPALRIHAAGAFAAAKIEHDSLIIEYPTIQEINKAVTGRFSDVEFINLYAMRGSIPVNVKKMQTDAWLVSELGLMQGDPDGCFRPYGALTRAEVLTIIDRCLTD